MVLDEYIDNDASAFSGKPRPEYERMLHDIASGRIDGLLVWHQDRLSRRPIDLEHFFEVIDRAGISGCIRTVTGNTDYQTGDGILTARLLSAVAANESATKSRRIRRKKEELAAAGLPVTGGRRPFGYTRDQLELEHTEADIVRELAARFLAGESVKSLTEWVEATGVPTSAGGQWRTTTIRQILTSPRIAGLVEHRGEVVGPAKWPAIISVDNHRRICSTFAARKRSGHRTPQSYLLTGGLIRCGKCGSSLFSAPRQGVRRYGCLQGPDHRGCGGIFITAEHVERLVADAVIYRLDTPELAAALSARGDAQQEGRSATDMIEQATDRLREVGQMFASGEISRREFLDIRRTITDQQQGAERRLARMAKSEALAGLPGNGQTLATQWTTLALSRQQAIIRSIVDHVSVGPSLQRGPGFRPERVSLIWRL